MTHTFFFFPVCARLAGGAQATDLNCVRYHDNDIP